MNTKKVWFVNGASKGLGLNLVKKLLAEGYRVAATSRNLKTLSVEVDYNTSNFLPLQVDLVNEGSVTSAIHRAIELFGNIDVVVNNAGYGQLGTLEELTDKEARQNFDINVFGTLNVIRAIMPHASLQEQKGRTHHQHFVYCWFLGCISRLGYLQRYQICGSWPY